MQQENTPLMGQCLCGGIQYQVDALESKMGHCHCTMCRKFHGAAFATYGEAKVENFHWLNGQELLQTFKADNGTSRQFCRVCGSSMTFQSAGDVHDIVEFSMATLESHTSHRADVHVYTEHKASWFDISDNLSQFKNARE